MTLIRRIAVALLRFELDARENAARTLAAGTYQEVSAQRAHPLDQ